MKSRAIMRVELSKRLRTIVRDLAAKAHEREMRRLLAPLADAFAQWRLDKNDTWTLIADMDRFKERRWKLSQTYQTASIAPMLVARAIVAGLLYEDEVSPEVRKVLASWIEYYQKGLADGSIRLEEDED